MARDGKYHQGRFNPRNPEKYKGDTRNIIYRSSWELKFLQWCDRSENILEYGSEEFFIPYLDPNTGKIRRYFPDAYVKVKEANGKIKKYIIEIKPLRQTQPPVAGKKKKQTLITEALTYEKNLAKWEAARSWCADRMLEFKIITEHDLGI